ncbi:D-glycerate dehydrogenase [Novosphingobium resinovorum]|uniref:2-hydroxyacid dehydrogenase n=1 Tax=Novosphingobium resinovorum TaxID=158500 RepID=UPI002ED04170|nr:D-glycerate dehydrogenase [Novosphingobium resinovorum]
MARPRAFLARRFTPAVEAAIEQNYEVVRAGQDRGMSAEEIAGAARGAEVIFVSTAERVTAATIAALAPALRVIATLSAGHDHIDLDAARASGVAVLTTPDVLSEACAEIGMMLILNAARRAHEADLLVRGDNWHGFAPTLLLGRGLVGKRLGILGMGRIGREVAARARAFGMAIHYHNRSRLAEEREAGATHHASPEALFAHSDVLCLCAPGGTALERVVDARRIALLPAGAIVVNLARGEMIDDDALIAALGSGHVFAAGLDVFAGEPAIHPGYRGLANVFLSPHIGSATIETRDAMGMLLVDGLDALARGETPSNQLC